MRAPVSVSLVLLSIVAGRATAKAPPHVVVTVVIDQLAAWELDERRGLLPPTGGFARLFREGTYDKEMRYAHAATDTAAGHAALYTGHPPRHNGIISNERVDPADPQRRISALVDPATRLIDDRGTTAVPSSSLRTLHGDTLADRLVAEQPAARVVAISLKDRGALFAAGRTPSAALWYDVKTDRLVTSSVYAAALPRWATKVVRGPVSRTYGRTFTRTLPSSVLPVGLIDDRPSEGTPMGGSRTFPHAVTNAEQLRASPEGDRLVLDLARAAIAEPVPPTLLALSFSSHDYVAHVYGSDSIEAYEELFAIDRTLAELMRALDRRYGASGWSMLLTADHGATPVPEQPTAERTWCRGDADRWQRPCSGGRRIDRMALGDQLELAARKVTGQSGWVAGVVDPYVQLGARYYEAEPRVRAQVLRVLTTALTSEVGIARVFETSWLPVECPPEDVETIEALVCRATALPQSPEERRGGELYVLLSPGAFFDTQVAPRHGGSHGTPYLFDRAVPLVARDLGCVARGVVLEAPLSYASFFHTASALLGISKPTSDPRGKNECVRPR